MGWWCRLRLERPTTRGGPPPQGTTVLCLRGLVSCHPTEHATFAGCRCKFSATVALHVSLDPLHTLS